VTLTPEQYYQVTAIAIVAAAVVLLVAVAAIWHFNHHDAIRRARQTAIDNAAKAAETEQAATRQHERMLKEMEVEQAKYKRDWDNQYSAALRDVARDYHLFCPECGKPMTLQQVARERGLPAIPPAEDDEDGAADPARRRKRKRE
jgi:hypothetical protein